MVLESEVCRPGLAFYMEAEDLNLDPHACSARQLLTKSSAPDLVRILNEWMTTGRIHLEGFSLRASGHIWKE